MEVVRIAELADDRGMVEDREFEEVEIRGPAMLAVAGGTFAFENNELGGSFDAMFHSTEKPVVLGVVGLHNVTFRRCRFVMVGVMGPPELIERFGGDLLRDP